MCSTPRPLVGFIDATFCQPIAHKHNCKPSHWHTHTHTRAHTRTTAENTPDQWVAWNAGFVSPHSSHLSFMGLNVRPLSHICGQLISATMLCVGRRSTVALGQSPFVCALRDISGSVWVGRKLKRFHSFIVSVGLMSGTGITTVRLRSHVWRQISQSFDFLPNCCENY